MNNTVVFLKQSPFIRLVIPLVAGILLRLNIEIPSFLALCAIIITFVLSFGLAVLRKFSHNFKYRWLFGLNIFLLFFSLGTYLTGEEHKVTDKNLTKTIAPSEYIGVITDLPEERAKSVRFFVEIKQEKSQEKFINRREKVLCYVKKDSASLLLKAGDVILFKTAFEDIESSGNPFEFDYKKYLSYQGIRFSTYIDQQYWKRMSGRKLPVIQLWAIKTGNMLEAVFSKIGMTGQELGVASALIIGDKAGLDKEIKQAYVASGAMHILAVSGMHVALLYWVLNMLLSFLDRKTYGKLLKLIILLMAVWFYALITGMGGSILRAAAMITFVIAGQALNRRINIFNSLAASAFFLLLYNPYNLVDVGFQLSYFAVISIVIFYPLIYQLFEFESWLGNQIWSLTAVTLSAQVLATPISLFYFHQFPNLFLISNLIMIPLSTLIMYFAMVLVVCSFWNGLALLMGKVFNLLVWLLNQVVLIIEGLPYALTKGIYITWFDVCLLYLFVVLITLYFIKKRAGYLISGLVTILILAFSGFMQDFQYAGKSQIIVYKEMNNSIIQFNNGSHSTWLIGENNERTKPYIEHARDAMHSRNNEVFLLDSVISISRGKGLSFKSGLWMRGDFLQFGGKRMVILNGPEANKTIDNPVSLDYVIVRNNKSNHYSDKAFKNYLSHAFIIDASISKFKAKKLEKILLEKRVSVMNIASSGAWIFKLH